MEMFLYYLLSVMVTMIITYASIMFGMKQVSVGLLTYMCIWCFIPIVNVVWAVFNVVFAMANRFCESKAGEKFFALMRKRVK